MLKNTALLLMEKGCLRKHLFPQLKERVPLELSATESFYNYFLKKSLNEKVLLDQPPVYQLKSRSMDGRSTNDVIESIKPTPIPVDEFILICFYLVNLPNKAKKMFGFSLRPVEYLVLISDKEGVEYIATIPSADINSFINLDACIYDRSDKENDLKFSGDVAIMYPKHE